MDGNKPKVGAQSGTMTLTDNSNGKSIDLPVLEGSVGPKVIDVRSLYAKTGYFTYDPGFMATAACRSSITYIDGDEGVLMYRGYPIQELAAKSDFLEVAYLLLNGELPTADQKTQFVSDITHHTMVHEQIATFFRGFRRDAHPMAVLCGVVGALSAFYHELDRHQRSVPADGRLAPADRQAADDRRYGLQIRAGPAVHLSEELAGLRRKFPSHDLRGAVRGVQGQSRAGQGDGPDLHPPRRPRAERLDRDRAQRRVVGRQPVRLYRGGYCLAMGSGAWRRQRGGAEDAGQDRRSKGIPDFISQVKDKHNHEILFGFGHRVYKNYDPRAHVLRESCHDVLNDLGIKDDPLLDLAMELEKIALNDDYFISRKLYPNVDFYSGIILKAMGFPTSMFTVLFAIARTVGWIAQWTEMIEDPDTKLSRHASCLRPHRTPFAGRQRR